VADGELDAVISARQPSCFAAGHPLVRRLFPDYRAAERDYYRRTGVFPIMHAVGIRRDVLEKHPWLPASVYKAFVQAKRLADAEFAEVTALKIGLPWLTAEFDATRELMGDDFWSYGVEPNRKTLELMARYSHEQGLARPVTVEEIRRAPGRNRYGRRNEFS
jgi:4,5-dihydroxyphthalate decarboxylase